MRYTQKQMDAAFILVKNAKHWKDKINAEIPICEANVVGEAIIHFTGSVPSFSKSRRAGMIRVKADGYWLAIGA